MDESESDSDNGPAMFDDGDRYPLEGKFMNASDKAEILAMPEIKREEILAERSTEMERDRQNRALRQLLHAREAEQKRGDKKRKASGVDLDENQRKTSRQRTKVGGGRVGEASSGIDSLKRARDEKADRLKRRKEDLERNGGHRASNHDQSDDDAGEDSELEWDDGKPKHGRSASPPTHSPPCELSDVHKVSIGRTKFAKLCFYPGFEEAYAGGFVRISVGADKETGDNVYRMAQING
jgi:RNA polymerase-associated protein RTF1